jgi:hypothetical protein
VYTRGYVDALTDDPLIAGEQAMCACVEDMIPIARADCTEVIGRTNYTTFQDGDGGPLVILPIPDAFYLTISRAENRKRDCPCRFATPRVNTRCLCCDE